MDHLTPLYDGSIFSFSHRVFIRFLFITSFYKIGRLSQSDKIDMVKYNKSYFIKCCFNSQIKNVENMKSKMFISFILISSLLFSIMPQKSYATDFSTLDQTVKSASKKVPKLALYYQNLVTGQSYSYQSTNVFSAASTIKLPLVLYVYELAAQNKINLHEKLTYKSHHYYGGSGVIQNEQIGSQYTIKELVEKSVVYSDNIAFTMLREKVGQANFIQYANSIGGTVVYPEWKEPNDR